MQYGLTKRQKELLEILYEYIKESGYPPSFEEIRERLGVSSNQSVIDHLEKLKSGGFIKRGVSGARNIAILPRGYDALGRPAIAPFLGVTSAGAPIEAIEISGQWKEVPGGISRLEEEVFMLRVAGDSMINAGIDDGDVALVQTKKEFVSGEIVLAQVGDEATIKRFISEDKPPYVYLKPENPEYQNILFTDETELKGKVLMVLKGGCWRAVK